MLFSSAGWTPLSVPSTRTSHNSSEVSHVFSSYPEAKIYVFIDGGGGVGWGGVGWGA